MRIHHQILDLLWSDPQTASGCRPNLKRGGGSYFGPDVTSSRLSQMKMGLLVRSHECCPQGWKLDHEQSVLTIFSASNYYGQNTNMGAFIQLVSQRFYEFTPENKTPEHRTTILTPVEATALTEHTAKGPKPKSDDRSTSFSSQLLTSPPSDASKLFTRSTRRRKAKGNGTDRNIELVIQPKVVKFKTGKSGTEDRVDRNGSEDAAFQLLCKRLLAKKQELLDAFHIYDPEKTGEVSINQWCNVMVKVAGYNLPWRILRHALVASSVTNPNTHVIYLTMFDSRRHQNTKIMKKQALSDCYGDLDQMALIFKEFDNEGVALVSVKNFCATCEHLHSSQGKSFDAKAIEKIAFLIDFNNDGYIDFNEFVEAARLVTSE
ncbi:unnamed protein product [Dibothriocephalus latus]|uniref:EF-hand domain-containing protein n=1 Tax=Dibothriocephalus latus TaxID=60516 RepID=A0A3P6TN56_DIBLA|nr:unnamed protein product [Dibothriocephalus latus]